MAQPYAARLVGRDAEIGALRVELDAALGGEGRLVVLIGDAGIGKTRTATALATEARDRGAVIVWGRCHEGEGAPVYWPWVQALGAYVAERAGRGVEEIALLLPLLRARAAAPDAVPEQARFELFDRVAQALVAAAREHPLAVVLDDLHWADHGSLLLLEFVAREIGTARLLVLATLRDAELRQRSDVAPLLATVLRLGHGVPLRGLPPDAVRELLSDRMGKPPGDALVDEVLAVTDGNPFFVIELAQLLALDGADGGAARRRPVIPPGAQELLRRRLAPMPPASRRLLEAAAVVGREFDLGPLATIMAAPVADLVAALEPALRAGLVRAVPDVLRRYTFTHALMRETLYDDLASGARMQLHAAVGEALETSGTADEERLPMLAHHFFEAAQGGDPAKAVRYGCEAGERALRLLAFEEAVRHFERALAAVALVGDEEARLRVLAGLADALHGTGNQERAEAVFRDALGVARGRGASTFAEAVLRFAGARAELGAPDFEMSALLEEALAGLPPDPGALRARVMVRLAAGLLVQPGSEAYRKVLADDALEIARGLGDPTALAFVLTRRQVALVGPDTLDERLATTDEVLRMGTGGRAAELEALTFRLHGLAELGDRAGLDHVLAVFEQKARGFRHPGFLWTAASARAAMALLEGRFADAETLAGEALALGQRVQTRTPMLNYAQQLFMLRGEQGRLAEVEPLITAGVAETAVVPAWRVGLASFYCFVRRDVEARCEFDALAADDFAGLPRDSAWLTGIYLLGTVCGRLRDLRRAEVLYELTRPYAGRSRRGRAARRLRRRHGRAPRVARRSPRPVRRRGEAFRGCAGGRGAPPRAPVPGAHSLGVGGDARRRGAGAAIASAPRRCSTRRRPSHGRSAWRSCSDGSRRRGRGPERRSAGGAGRGGAGGRRGRRPACRADGRTALAGRGDEGRVAERARCRAARRRLPARR